MKWKQCLSEVGKEFSVVIQHPEETLQAHFRIRRRKLLEVFDAFSKRRDPRSTDKMALVLNFRLSK